MIRIEIKPTEIPDYRNDNPLYQKTTDTDFPHILKEMHEPYSKDTLKYINECANTWKQKYGINTAKFFMFLVNKWKSRLELKEKTAGESTKAYRDRQNYIVKINQLYKAIATLYKKEMRSQEILQKVNHLQQETTEAIIKQQFIGAAKGLSSPNDPKLKVLGEISVFLEKISKEIIQSDEYQQLLITEIQKKS